MIQAYRRAAPMVDRELHGVAEDERPLCDVHRVDDEIAELLLGICHADRKSGSRDRAGVADLPARFTIKGGLVHDREAALAGGDRLDRLAGPDEPENDAFGCLRIVAEELRRARLVADGEPDGFRRSVARPGPGGACLLALALH